MHEIKCPKCGTVFTIDEDDYVSILNQVRDIEFKKELDERESLLKKEKDSALKLMEMEVSKKHQEEINDLKFKIKDLESTIKIKDTELEQEINKVVMKKDQDILELKNTIDLNDKEYILKEKNIKEKFELELKTKDELIEYYKDLKARQSTKMVGESLEKHCNAEFARIRPMFSSNTYFEKDNDAKTGSKGDFIFRDFDSDGNEIVSIMFEMKNEADETSTKHKNEDFFKELDKDRKEKNCEYAVLVSLLEIDNEIYNTGIVDVSYKYDKMYVIRPQFFVPIITLIRNAALRGMEYKRKLIEAENQNLDIAHFEENINAFKEGFGRNYRLASEKFKKAIEEIDKTIDHLQKTKDALLSSENNLRLANNKAEDLSIRKLAGNNKTIEELFKNQSDE